MEKISDSPSEGNQNYETRFVMLEKEKSLQSKHDYNTVRVEFRPGASSDKVIEENNKKQEAKNKIMKAWTDIDYVKDAIDSMIKSNNPFSETFKLNSDGRFDKENRVDGLPPYLTGWDIETPADLYKIAQEIQIKNPEYNFKFETDPEGSWMKYTVAKI